MSTTHVPFSFYGRYFPSHEAAEAFLSANGCDYDSDSIYDEKPDVLGLQSLQDDTCILGFALQPGESDAAAKALWAKRVFSGETEAQSHFELFTY